MTPELFRALAALAERPANEHRAIAAALDLPGTPDEAAYTELFSFALYPYGSVYLGAEGMLGGDARDRFAGFWRALGLEPPSEPDHLAVLLAFYAELGERVATENDATRRASLERTRRAFLWEHLVPWVPVYARKMRAIANPFYAGWAALLERAIGGDAAGCATFTSLPAHLRDAACVADPRTDGAAAFVGSLLAPLRSGLIIVRHDLARAANDLRLGLRHGERRFVLEALFAQDRTAVLRWLAAETERAAADHRASTAVPGAVREVWSARAEATARLLRELAAESESHGPRPAAATE